MLELGIAQNKERDIFSLDNLNNLICNLKDNK